MYDYRDVHRINKCDTININKNYFDYEDSIMNLNNYNNYIHSYYDDSNINLNNNNDYNHNDDSNRNNNDYDVSNNNNNYINEFNNQNVESNNSYNVNDFFHTNTAANVCTENTNEMECKACNKYFQTEDKLIEHILYTHKKKSKVISEYNSIRNKKPTIPPRVRKQKLFICDICNTVIYTRSTLVTHMQQHQGIFFCMHNF